MPNNFQSVGLGSKFVMKSSLNILTPIKHVAALSVQYIWHLFWVTGQWSSYLCRPLYTCSVVCLISVWRPFHLEMKTTSHLVWFDCSINCFICYCLCLAAAAVTGSAACPIVSLLVLHSCYPQHWTLTFNLCRRSTLMLSLHCLVCSVADSR